MGRRLALLCAVSLLWGCAGQRASRRARAQLAILDEILASRNDNDPRLDTEFNELSSEARELLRERYRGLPLEARNERGTVVYLLGKDPAPEDWEFLLGVVKEPPCLSLSDCAQAARTPGGHHARGDAITLAYPALVALRQAGRALRAEPGNAGAKAVIEAGERSGTKAVSRMARRLSR